MVRGWGVGYLANDVLVSRRRFVASSCDLLLLGAIPFTSSAFATEDCCEPLSPLSLTPGAWSFRSTNPADKELLRRNGDVLETIGGYGLTWYTAESFSDFVILLEWRVTKVENNSGIFLRTPGPDQVGRKNPLDAARDHGHEVQIDERGFDTADETSGHPKKKTGAIYDLKAPLSYQSSGVGAWNQFIIGAKREWIWVVLNGALVNTYRSHRAPSGFLALQSFGPHSRVQFRNLRIARL